MAFSGSELGSLALIPRSLSSSLLLPEHVMDHQPLERDSLLARVKAPPPWRVEVQRLTLSAPSPALVIPLAVPITIPRAVQRRLLRTKMAEPKVLVQDASLTCDPGELVALIGGSGSGKTTLLTAIAQRSDLLHGIGGTIKYSPCTRTTDTTIGSSTDAEHSLSTSPKIPSGNGASAKPLHRVPSAAIGYVAQHDTLLPYLTVRETLSFAAALRLPTSVDKATREAIVEQTLLELGLRDVADVIVGGGYRKGISGGEKRRLTVGTVLVTLPSVLVLDEPTTGLSTSDSLMLLRTLKRLADRGRAVILSIHQPRSEVFGLLDKICLLSRGRIIYSGHRSTMLPYFESLPLGLSAPFLANPLDWIVDISSIDTRNDTVEAESRARVGALVTAWQEHELKLGALDGHPPKKDAMQQLGDVDVERGATVARSRSQKRDIAQARPNAIQQLAILTRRGLRNQSRNVAQTSGFFLQAVLIGIGLGLAFFQLPETPAGIQSLVTVCYYSSPGYFYLSIVVYVFLLCDELIIIDRERADNLYQTLPAALALLISYLPSAILGPIIYALIVYGLVGLRRDGDLTTAILSFVAQCVMQQLSSFAYALLATSVNRSFASASLLANGFSILFVLGSGYLITDLPVWSSWTRWLSPYFYGFNWIARTQLQSRTFACEGIEGVARSSCEGDAILRSFNLRLATPLYVYPLGLLGFFIVTFSLATLLLAYFHPGGVKHAATQESRSAPKPQEQLEVADKAERHGVDVVLEGVGLSVSTRSLRAWQSQEKVILADISANFPRGQLSAIMGPSGAGKSSLLQVLAARLSSSYATSGSVTLNGRPLGPSTAALVAFIEQEDGHHLPALTVRETLCYAARLRLRNKSAAECDSRADEVLRQLGLKLCADNVVGGPLLKGISGGEKRRLSLGVSLLDDPELLYCDEPTSGLDAALARDVMETLQEIARSGRTVVVTCHQPRSDIFEMFDNVLLLAKGGVTAYSGPRSAIFPAFAEAGEICDERYNPADFLLDAISVSTSGSVEQEEKSRLRVEHILETWRGRHAAAEKLKESAPPSAQLEDASFAHGKRRSAPFFTAFPVILRRSVINLWREKDAAIARLINPVFMACLFFIFFARLTYAPSSAQIRVGLLQETTALPFVGMLSCLAIFPQEKRLYLHEYGSSARQSPFTFLLAYTTQEVTSSLVASLMFSLVFVYGMNMQHSARIFIEFWFSSFALLSFGESVGIIFSSFFSSGGLAVSITSAVITLLSMLNGIISVTLPYWLEVVGWISPMKPQTRVQIINEMRGLVFDCTDAEVSSGVCNFQTGEQLLDTFSIAPTGTGKLFGILFALVVFWRLLSFLALYSRSQVQ